MQKLQKMVISTHRKNTLVWQVLFFWSKISHYSGQKKLPSANCTKILLGKKKKKPPKLPYLEGKKSHVTIFRLGMSSFNSHRPEVGRIFLIIYFIKKIKTKYFRAFQLFQLLTQISLKYLVLNLLNFL